MMVFQSLSIKYGVGCLGQKGQNFEKKPSDVRYSYFYNKNGFYICFNSREEPSRNEFSLPTSLFVFVETIALLLTMCESIC